jgi:hypothetical protein
MVCDAADAFRRNPTRNRKPVLPARPFARYPNRRMFGAASCPARHDGRSLQELVAMQTARHIRSGG